MVDKSIQRYAEEHVEPRMAKALGGASFPNSEPCDLKLPADPKQSAAWVKATEDYRAAMAAWEAGGKKGQRPAMAKPDGKPGGLVELKTMVGNGNDKITMDSYAQVRKAVLEKESGAPYHTVVIDDRAVFSPDGSHDESGRVYYYRRGIAGSARVSSLHKCRDLAELKRLMAAAEADLPAGARRTDAHITGGDWVPFEDAGGKGFKDKKTGQIVRAKK
jgi:hypothetical protein